MEMSKQNSILSTIGIGLGAIALLMAFIHFWAGPFAIEPPIQQAVSEKAIALKEATIAALTGEESIKENTQRDIDEILKIIIAALAGLAIIFGVVGYAKKEPIHVSSGAVFLGIGAIVFQLLIMTLT